MQAYWLYSHPCVAVESQYGQLLFPRKVGFIRRNHQVLFAVCLAFTTAGKALGRSTRNHRNRHDFNLGRIRLRVNESPNWFYSRIFHSRIFCSRIFHSRITGTLGFSTLGFFLRFCLRLYPVVFLDLLTFAVAAPEVLSLLADCMRTGLQANCSKISFSLD